MLTPKKFEKKKKKNDIFWLSSTSVTDLVIFLYFIMKVPRALKSVSGFLKQLIFRRDIGFWKVKKIFFFTALFKNFRDVT